MLIVFWIGVIAMTLSLWGLLLSGWRIFFWTILGAVALLLFSGIHFAKKDYE